MKKIEVDPKEVVHYYTDGGVKQRSGSAAFLRKGFGLKPKEVVRFYKQSKKMSTTDCDIRAVRLAVEDAISEGFDLSKVVIHTDQIALSRFIIKDKTAKLRLLRDELQELGVNVVHTRSTHDLEYYNGIPEEEIPARVKNSLKVHNLVNEAFGKRNRWQNHVCKKNRRERKYKKIA